MRDTVTQKKLGSLGISLPMDIPSMTSLLTVYPAYTLTLKSWC